MIKNYSKNRNILNFLLITYYFNNKKKHTQATKSFVVSIKIKLIR